MRKPADLFAGPKKVWAKTKPVRYVLGLAFILHGWVRLGTDFTEWRQPFILHDLGQWWANVQTWWANYRGIKVKVSR